MKIGLGMLPRTLSMGVGAVQRMSSVGVRWSSTLLLPPTVIFQDNHILVVNKPPGWHSVPNKDPSPKCLLNELKQRKLGGGSHKDFLLPLHRIDQPCSGALMYGKTSKAGTRITKLFKKKMVQKEYLCVIQEKALLELEDRSEYADEGWHNLAGTMIPNPSQNSRSVIVRPSSYKSVEGQKERHVSLTWKHELLKASDGYSKNALIRVKAIDGARHVVRALLAQVGKCPIEGDVRYGTNMPPLKDMSVALHAFRIHLDPSLKLGTLEQRSFEAPMPESWIEYFGIGER